MYILFCSLIPSDKYLFCNKIPIAERLFEHSVHVAYTDFTAVFTWHASNYFTKQDVPINTNPSTTPVTDPIPHLNQYATLCKS